MRYVKRNEIVQAMRDNSSFSVDILHAIHLDRRTPLS
jgi:hypothetical protein